MQARANAFKKLCRQWSLYLLLIIAGVAGSVYAHHSFASFDQSQSKSVEGTVRAFEFQFPHSWIWLDVPDGKGGTRVWGFEGAGPVELNRIGGWTAKTLRPGDKVSVTFCPLRNGEPGGAFTSVKLPDGRLMKGFGLACMPKKPQ